MKLRDKQAKIWESKNTAEHYWSAEKHKNRRKWFVETLEKFRFGSIYEIGCNSGRNLWEIKKAYPDKLVGGIDINKKAIDFAKKKMPYGIFYTGNIHEMSTEDKYDVIFTSGVLLHIPPKDVKSILNRCIQKANKYILHMETNGESCVINGPKELKPIKKTSDKLRCIHNYAKLYEELGYGAAIRQIPDCKEDDAAHIVVVKLSEVPWRYR